MEKRGSISTEDEIEPYCTHREERGGKGGGVIVTSLIVNMLLRHVEPVEGKAQRNVCRRANLCGISLARTHTTKQRAKMGVGWVLRKTKHLRLNKP